MSMRRLIILAFTLFVACVPPRRKPPTRPTGINHRIEDTFKTLMSTKALDKALPTGWKLDRFASGVDSLTLGFLDAAGVPHTVELLLKPSAGEPLQGKGQFFSFRIAQQSESAENIKALLDAARIVDEVTPIEALVAESNSPPPKQGLAERFKTAEPPVVIALGAIQVVIIAAGIVVALVAGRRRRAD